MGQSGDPHQVRKIFGLCIQEHLHGKVRSEFRDPQGSQLTAADILGRDAQGRGILEQAHDLPAVQRDILYRIQADQVLEHTDHGGIIMAQDIQL